MTRETARRFHFIREIASGTFGSVFLAKEIHDDGFSRLVAVKLLHQRWAESREVAQRMRDEARLLGWLRNRNIVDVYDLTSIDGRAAVIMEYLEAADIKSIIDEARRTESPVPIQAALEMAAAVASALDAAYNRPPYPGEKPLRVIHRDIKPGNIMIDESGLVKVLDFGVAQAEFHQRESATQDLQFGSVDYMAPERLFFEPETPSSDIYSLGATLFEMLALDKLGKARGRPERHKAYIHERLSFLQGMRGIGTRVALPLNKLLLDMLAWEGGERPAATAVSRSCRDLARSIDDGPLADWAERCIPPIVTLQREANEKAHPLADMIMGEDSQLLRRQDSLVFTGARAIPPPPERGAVDIDEQQRTFGRLGVEIIKSLRPQDDSRPAGSPPVSPPEPVRPSLDASPPPESATPAPPAPHEAREAAPAPSKAAQGMAEVTKAAQDPTPASGQNEPQRGLELVPAPLPDVQVEDKPTTIMKPDDGMRDALRKARGAARAEFSFDERPTTVGVVSGTTEAPSLPPLRTGSPGAAPSEVEETDARGYLPRPPTRLSSVIPAAPPRTAEIPAPARPSRRTPMEAPHPSSHPGLLVLMLAAPLLGTVLGALVFLGVMAPSRSLSASLDRPPSAPATPTLSSSVEPPASTSARFVAKGADIQKMQLRCGNLERSGGGEVAVDATGIERCVVTAIQADRTRIVAIVDGVRAGRYDCFVDGAKRCDRAP